AAIIGDAADDITRIIVKDAVADGADVAFAIVARRYGEAHARAALGTVVHWFLHVPKVAEIAPLSAMHDVAVSATGAHAGILATIKFSRIIVMADSMPEIKLDADNMYREETFSDLKVGSVRRLIPVTADGSDDSSRSVRYEG